MKKYTQFLVYACVFAVILCSTSIGLAIDLNSPPKIQTPHKIVAKSWYYVSASGNSKGPVTLTELRQLYQNKAINQNTFVWNGTTVTQWTRLSDLPDILKQLISPKAPLRK